MYTNENLKKGSLKFKQDNKPTCTRTYINIKVQFRTTYNSMKNNQKFSIFQYRKNCLAHQYYL